MPVNLVDKALFLYHAKTHLDAKRRNGPTANLLSRSKAVEVVPVQAELTTQQSDAPARNGLAVPITAGEKNRGITD